MANKKSILLRIDPDLWEALNTWAKDELRSLNAQIEWALRESVRKRLRAASPPSTGTQENPSNLGDEGS